MDPLDLHAFADGELDQDGAVRVRSALSSDPQAQAQYDAILNLKDVVSSHAVKYDSQECWRACVGRLNEIDKSRRVESFVGRYAWSLCAVLFALILSGRYMMQGMRGNTAQIADIGRILPLHGSSSSPATSAQTHLYQNVLNQARAVVGGPVAQSEGEFLDIPVRMLMFRGVPGNVKLIVMPESYNFEDAAEMPTDPGVFSSVLTTPTGVQDNCVIWHKGDSTFVIAGERSVQDLDAIRERITAH